MAGDHDLVREVEELGSTLGGGDTIRDMKESFSKGFAGLSGWFKTSSAAEKAMQDALKGISTTQTTDSKDTKKRRTEEKAEATTLNKMLRDLKGALAANKTSFNPSKFGEIDNAIKYLDKFGKSIGDTDRIITKFGKSSNLSMLQIWSASHNNIIENFFSHIGRTAAEFAGLEAVIHDFKKNYPVYEQMNQAGTLAPGMGPSLPGIGNITGGPFDAILTFLPQLADFDANILETNKALQKNLQEGGNSALAYNGGNLNTLGSSLNIASEAVQKQANVLARMDFRSMNDNLLAIQQQFATQGIQTKIDSFRVEQEEVRQFKVFNTIAANTGLTADAVQKMYQKNAESTSELNASGVLTEKEAAGGATALTQLQGMDRSGKLAELLTQRLNVGTANNSLFVGQEGEKTAAMQESGLNDALDKIARAIGNGTFQAMKEDKQMAFLQQSFKNVRGDWAHNTALAGILNQQTGLGPVFGAINRLGTETTPVEGREDNGGTAEIIRKLDQVFNNGGPWDKALQDVQAVGALIGGGMALAGLLSGNALALVANTAALVSNTVANGGKAGILGKLFSKLGFGGGLPGEAAGAAAGAGGVGGAASAAEGGGILGGIGLAGAASIAAAAAVIGVSGYKAAEMGAPIVEPISGQIVGNYGGDEGQKKLDAQNATMAKDAENRPLINPATALWNWISGANTNQLPGLSNVQLPTGGVPDLQRPAYNMPNFAQPFALPSSPTGVGASPTLGTAASADSLKQVQDNHNIIVGLLQGQTAELIRIRQANESMDGKMTVSKSNTPNMTSPFTGGGVVNTGVQVPQGH